MQCISVHLERVTGARLACTKLRATWRSEFEYYGTNGALNQVSINLIISAICSACGNSNSQVCCPVIWFDQVWITVVTIIMSLSTEGCCHLVAPSYNRLITVERACCQRVGPRGLEHQCLVRVVGSSPGPSALCTYQSLMVDE